MVQSVAQPLNVICAGGFDHEFDFGLANGDPAESPALADLQNIRALVGYALGEAGKIARAIGDDYVQTTLASVLYHALFNDSRNQIHVDVAARDD